MAERESVHAGLATRGSGWRAWIVALAMVLAGATLVTAIFHEEHAADQDCAVCQLRHQPAAELSESVQIGFADVPQPLEQADDGDWPASGHSHRLSARGPPA